MRTTETCFLRKDCWKDEKMPCPRCDFENDPAGPYCQQCGTYLQPFTPAPQPQAGFPIPPPAPLEYSTPPFISAGMHAELFSSQQMASSRPHMRFSESFGALCTL